jgi:hypothetical protein
MADEIELREKLGIPKDAEKIILFSESAHWDPDWLLTSNEYYKLLVERNLKKAVRELQKEQDRIYSVECMFFVKMFYERSGVDKDLIVELLNKGRLRIMGTGVTTPDTILPKTDFLIKDYVLGKEWLKQIGVESDPRIAYFPDSFGHSPELPTIMNHLGIRAAGICRIDGMYFFGCETEPKSKFPRPNSSADLLFNKEKSQDFVWVSSSGQKLLTHWVAYGYGHGELLAHIGFTRVCGVPLAFYYPKLSLIKKRIDKYVKQLSQASRTPYLYCPIGFDFSAPITNLSKLLKAYNEAFYDVTGIWALNAGLDDYFDLISCYRDKLPELTLDPNPYFTGFYTSRRTLKEKTFLLYEDIETMELKRAQNKSTGLTDELRSAYWTSVSMNHHDCITGTSPDRVVKREQLKWIRKSDKKVKDVLSQYPADTRPKLELKTLTKARKQEESISFGDFKIDIKDGNSPLSGITFGEKAVIKHPGITINSYEDHGGLWRMGFEYKYSRFRLIESSQKVALNNEIDIDTKSLLIRNSFVLDDMPVGSKIHITDINEAVLSIRLNFKLLLKPRRSVSLRLPLEYIDKEIEMQMPGGFVKRPISNTFREPYWPFNTIARIPTQGSLVLGIIAPIPGSLAVKEENGNYYVELLMARNAIKEKFLNVIPTLAFPARGHDPGPHEIEYILLIGDREKLDMQKLKEIGDQYERQRIWLRTGYDKDFSSLFEIERSDLFIDAVYPSHNSKAIVLRIYSFSESSRMVRVLFDFTKCEKVNGYEETLSDVKSEGIQATLELNRGYNSFKFSI